MLFDMAPLPNPDILDESPIREEETVRLDCADRLKTIKTSGLLDLPRQTVFDATTELARQYLSVPVALLTIVSPDQQFFVSSRGLAEPWSTRRSTPLTHSFCQHVVTRRCPLVVKDARKHGLVHENLAIRDLNVVAYLGVPLVGETGSVIGAFCAIDGAPRNWTSQDLEIIQKLAEAVIQEFDLLCHSRVAQRSQEFRLQKAERMETLGSLAGSVAHDFNNILTVIRNYAELIRMNVGDPESTRQYVDEVLAITDHGKAVVDRLVSVKAPDAEVKSLVNLSEEISELHNILSALFPSTTSINLQLSNQNAFIESTPAQICQIVLNLCSNAAHAMHDNPDGTLKIEISFVDQLKPGSEKPDKFVCLEIRDTGTGIPKELQERVCDLYFTTKESGVGIGLATVSGLVESHGGWLEIDSEIGKGTSVRTYFPSAVTEPKMLVKKS